MTHLMQKYSRIAFEEPEAAGGATGAEGGEAGGAEGAESDPTPEDPPAPAEPAPEAVPEAPPTDAATAAAAAAPPPAASDWKDKRIARLTALLHEAREQKKVENAPPAPDGAPLDPTADFDRRVAEAAREQVELSRFNDECSKIADKGNATFGAEFKTRVASLQKLINQNDPREVGQYTAFLRAAIKTGEGHRLIHDLGADLNKANDILNLDETSMAIELTKMALAKPAADPVSELPRPVKPIAGTQGAQKQIDPTDPSRSHELSTAEWMRRREAQVAAQSRR